MNRFIAFVVLCFSCSLSQAGTPNLLVITVDDMSCDSAGVFDGVIPDLTPNMDQLAAEGLRFEMAHVQVGNCYPSRNVMFSGRYPHSSGVEGFYQVQNDYPVFCDVMQKAGYFTAIRGKVSHSTPYQPYHWDADLTIKEDGVKEHIKDVGSYGTSLTRGIEKARAAHKPFAININISDPHKPFWFQGDPHGVSKIYTPEESPVPGFLFDDPIVREELALYYTSVRRADDAVGAILDALKKSGENENTIVFFLSDHGMPLPFAKTQLYHHSTRTPLIVRWPDVVQPETVDDRHMVSAIDFLPTFCDMVRAPHPDGLQGTSFLPLLQGKNQKGRSVIFKEYNENAGASRDPMRAVQTKRYLYLFNPWSDGKDIMRTATQGTKTYKRMKELAPTSESIQKRLDLFEHRVVEELYNVQDDPDCLINLIESEAHQEVLVDMRTRLKNWMKKTADPALVAFEGRKDEAIRRAYVDKSQEETNARRAAQRKNKPKKPKKQKLIKVIPKRTIDGISVVVEHTIPEQMDGQKVHVTLKQDGKRLERKIIDVSGTGNTEIYFPLPSDLRNANLSVAAFVGADYSDNLQHVVTSVK
ncbi:MAG: sulfatase family protein [Pirellulales bacterium]